MSQQVTLQVTMELLSDTIFGSGYSIPGGEDIAVCIDPKGYPYLKGATFKGLLRESVENLIAWEGGDPGLAALLFGTEGWSETDDRRKIHITAFTLSDAPADPADCFETRTFTALDNGIISKGSYRIASCIRRGLRFEGEVLCAGEDVRLIENALRGIRYLGTLRNRGFGHVRMLSKEATLHAAPLPQPPCACIHYSLYLKLPVQATNPEHSFDNSYETRPCVSGAAVRGMVMSRLAQNDPQWFEENRIKLLSYQTRFLDALPSCKEAHEGLPATIPTPMGFYEDAKESGLESILRSGTYTGVKKRAKVGTFCVLEDDTICYWKPETDSAMRIKRAANAKEKQVFQTQYLCAGQTLEGYILLDDPTLAPKIMDCLWGDVWLGADRNAGFGQCSVKAEQAEQPHWVKDYGIRAQEEMGTTLYMMLLSPAAAMDETGSPRAMDDAFFSHLLGVNTKIEHSATAVSEYKAYNRTWQCHSPAVRMYERGSVFKLQCQTAPGLDRLEALQKAGIGIRRNEGFGQVLFLSRERFERLSKKQKLNGARTDGTLPDHVVLRRKKMRWIQERSCQLAKYSVSASRLGEVQAQCEKAIANGGDTEALRVFISKYTTNKNPAIAADYKGILTLVNEVLDPDTELPIKDTRDKSERLNLLCMLLDYHRKGGGN